MASTISKILAKRYMFTFTNCRYDHDYNQQDDLNDDNTPYNTPHYFDAADEIPNSHYEKIITLLCSLPHQGILLFHQMIQGTIIP